MQAFTTIKSTAIPLPIEDVDTDHSLERIRFRGRVAYDGTGFRGWQIQSVGRTWKVSLCCFF